MFDRCQSATHAGLLTDIFAVHLVVMTAGYTKVGITQNAMPQLGVVLEGSYLTIAVASEELDGHSYSSR